MSLTGLAIPQTYATIRCLICSSANQPNIITSLCFQCYAAGATRSGHNHDISFYACDSDAILQDTKIPQEIWTMRRNSSKRMWYEHRASGYKTWLTPMTAVCGLPPGWEQRRDPEGNTYFENKTTGEMSRTPPGSLPPGWTEAKDPDGKLFFVHHEFQLASWVRPGQQPQISVPALQAKPVATQPSTTNHAAVQFTPRPPVGAAPNNVRTNSVATTPRQPLQRPPAVPRPSQQLVTLATATEATINLLDPTNGGIIRNTKIVGHIAGQSVKGTVNAVKQNQRLQTFARGTGLAAANKGVKKAWRKAAKEVASLDNYRRQEIKVTQSGSQGQIVVEGADTGFEGEYVIEYEDGTIEYYDANGKIRRTSTVGPQQNPTLVQRPAIQQRPTQQAQAQQTQVQQIQAQQLPHQHQQLASAPTSQPQYVYNTNPNSAQSQPNYVDQAVATFQQSIASPTSQPQNVNSSQTIYVDQAPAQTVYVDQAPAQTLFVDQTQAQTIYVDQAPAYTVDNTTVDVNIDVDVDVNIDQNVYVDQSYQMGQEQTVIIQDQTLVLEDGTYDQVYELQDNGCVDEGYEVESVDCGFSDVGFDF
jgi:hypothetical protein